MEDYSSRVSQAMRLLVEKAISADADIIENAMSEIAVMVKDGDKKAIAAFFKEDPKGVAEYLKSGKMPTSIAGKRFVAMYQSLASILDVIFEGETLQIQSFIASTGISAAQADALALSSLFMSPAIKQTILNEWVNKPYNGYPLSQRIWGLNKATENKLMQMVAAGFADGRNPKQLAGLVRGITGQQSASNIRRLLLTENSRVQHGVQKLAVREFRHISYVVLKFGVRHKEPCLCDPYQRKGRMKYEDAPDLPLHPSSSSYYQPIPTPIDEWKKEMGYV
ncbi:hypothetical protein [Deinococcus aquaticus]